MKFSDLKGLGSSVEQVYDKFTDKYGTHPDGMSLNYEIYRRGLHITSKYGYWSYKTLGETEFSRESTSSPAKVTMGSDVAYNHAHTPATISLSVSGTWVDSSSYSSSITAGMSFNTEFSIEGVFKMGTSFSFSATAGQSATHSESQTYTSTVSVTLPPRSKQRVSIVGSMKTATMHFRTPITVDGTIAANFPWRVQGHYFHYFDIDEVASTTGEIKGEVRGTSAFDINTKIDEVVPIDYVYED